jgi:hypothetical protein
MAEYTPSSKINYDLFKQNYDPNLPYNKQSETIQQKYNEDLFNKYSGIASEEPKLGFLDKLTGGLEGLFSAYGAEMPQVPNLDYGYNMPTFDLGTGITNTTQAEPFLKSMADINASGNVNADLVNQLIMENQMKAINRKRLIDQVPSQDLGIDTSYGVANEPDEFDPTKFRSIFPSNVAPMPQEPTGILSQVNQKGSLYNTLPIDTSYGVANEPDELDEEETEQYEVDKFGYRKEKNLLQKLAQYIPFAGEKSLGRAIIDVLPKLSPEAQNIRNFYGSQFGLTPTGQVASGIMKGYNPVSGSNLLNRFTGGLVPKKQIGLAPAIRRRIDRIANRKIAQTDTSRARIKELQDLARADTISRARFNNPNVYANADKLGFTDSSGGFKSAGTNDKFSNKTGRGRTGY